MQDNTVAVLSICPGKRRAAKRADLADAMTTHLHEKRLNGILQATGDLSGEGTAVPPSEDWGKRMG